MTVNGSDLAMTRGDSETITVGISGGTFSTGDVVTFSVRKNFNSELALQKVVTEFNEDGKAIIEIASSDTRDMSFGKHVYDIQLTRADGTVTTIVKPAVFEIEKEVTC